MKTIQNAVIQKDGKYLILKRGMKKKIFPGHWDFPGGVLEEGEDNFAGITREIKEETNYDVKNVELIFEYERMHSDNITRLHRIYKATVTGEFKISFEHTDYRWASKEEILKLEIMPQIRKYFETIGD